MANPTREPQRRHFAELFHRHVGTPMAVSSESAAHKQLRYDRLTRILPAKGAVSVHDVGMGMGALGEYLIEQRGDLQLEYSGSDIVPEYVDHCRKHFPDCSFHLRDLAESAASEQYDYVLMSGVFHQMRETPRADWEAFAQTLIANCFKMSRVGVAFNFVSEFVDFHQPHVYYCDLSKLLHFVNGRLSRFFTLDHAYPLFEFTVFVYHESHIAAMNTEPEFQKYFRGNRIIAGQSEGAGKA